MTTIIGAMGLVEVGMSSFTLGTVAGGDSVALRSFAVGGMFQCTSEIPNP